MSVPYHILFFSLTLQDQQHLHPQDFCGLYQGFTI